MLKPTYTRLDASLNPLPEGSTDEHIAVRVEHPLLKSLIIVSAKRAADAATFAEAQKIAAEFNVGGHKWRNPSVEEAFFIPDRTRDFVGLDTAFFPDADGYEYTWTSDVCSTPQLGGAWGVDLGDGSCDWLNQGCRYHVRPVLASQSLGLS